LADAGKSPPSLNMAPPAGHNQMADFHANLMASYIAAGQAEFLSKATCGTTKSAQFNDMRRPVVLQHHLTSEEGCGSTHRATNATPTLQQKQPSTKWNQGVYMPNNSGYQSNKPTSFEAPKSSSRQAQTLSASLQMLSNENPACLFIVRRINKLGFKAGRILKRHFGSFGAVVRVLVAHSTVRQQSDTACQARRRPSSLGFVHMASTSAVDQILKLGPEQNIEGAMIRIQKFERQNSEATSVEEQETEAAYLDDENDWKRETTMASDFSMLTASTAASTHGSNTQESSGDEKETCDHHN